MIKKMLIAVVLIPAFLSANAQQIDKIINAAEVERIERILSADDMQGRKTFTPGIEKAAAFIDGEFKKAGLKYLPGFNSYRQQFAMIEPVFKSASGTFDDSILNSRNIIAITTEPVLKINNTSGFTVVRPESSKSFLQEARRIASEHKNYIVLVNTSSAKDFERLRRLRQSFKKAYSVIFILTDLNPVKYNLEITHDIKEQSLANVVGVLPGKSKKDEYVIFSGHYDHLGIGKPNAAGDSIYNGANDDAAGTTAVIMLANYFSKMKSNERTLIFVAFTAEEVGGFGSQYFSKQVEVDKTVAMFNIEMIGTESKWGANSAYITGYEKSDFGKILQQNLAGTNFHFEPDPYPAQNLFYRSDNATLAALGVPAHTISTSKMDSEKNYHTQEDEFETLNMKNMAEVIKAIAISSSTIISGKDTPSRVEKVK